MAKATTDFVQFLRIFIFLTNFLERNVLTASTNGQFLPLRVPSDYQILTFSLSHLDFLFDCFAKAESSDPAQEAQNVILTLISRIVTNPCQSVVAAFVTFFDRVRELGPIAKTRVLTLILSYLDKTEEKIILTDFFQPRHKPDKSSPFTRKIHILFNQDTLSVDADPYATVMDLKKRLSRMIHVHCDWFWFTDASAQIVPSTSTLVEAQLEDGAILTVCADD
jgi:hypothetical protein